MCDTGGQEPEYAGKPSLPHQSFPELDERGMINARHAFQITI